MEALKLNKSLSIMEAQKKKQLNKLKREDE